MNQDERWLLEEKYGGVEGEAFHADCKRLAASEPFGYVIGHVPFLGCTIHLDSHPLIPRPETEFWVEKAIAAIKRETTKAPQILDLCAGSGCIGVAVAKACQTAIVNFAEIDPTHLPTIEKNLILNTRGSINRTPSVENIIIESDLFAALPTDKKYDFILSNPPYIDPVLDRAEPSVKAHEPHLALYGGQAGLTIIEKIITAAPTFLTMNGQLWLEHEPEQSEAIATLAHRTGFVCSTHQDQYGVDRYSVLVLTTR